MIRFFLAVVLALVVVLAAIPYVLPTLYGDFSSDVSINLDPYDVYLNESLYVNVSIPSSYNITAVVADMAGVDSISLELVDNSTWLHLWSSYWLVHDIVPGEHVITISAYDDGNDSYSVGTRLSILSDEISDNESADSDKNETVVITGLNLSLFSNKQVFIVNETILIEGIVSFNNSLINTSVDLLVDGPRLNVSIKLNITDGRFYHQFIPVDMGSYIVRSIVSYGNETIQKEIVLDVLNAPVEKLNKTAEKIVKQLKETMSEKRKLIKEIAKQESVVLGAKPEAETIKEVNDVKLVMRDFVEVIDVNRMVQTANEIIKRDEAVVAIFYGTDGENARIMVMAGKTAVERGVNANEIVREASTLIGGGGGGKTNFAQGGGTKTKKLPEAVKKAEQVLKKQLKH